MKKLLALILLFALLLTTASAEIDLSGMSEAELLALSRQIQLLLFGEKLAAGVTVNPGTYTIGEDIPAGSYKVDVVNPNVSGYLMITDASGEYVASHFLGEMLGTNTIGKLVLEDGQTVEISGTNVLFYSYAGMFN